MKKRIYFMILLLIIIFYMMPMWLTGVITIVSGLVLFAALLWVNHVTKRKWGW